MTDIPTFEYNQYQKGCMGLCTVRMGFAGGFPHTFAEKCFTTITAAEKYAHTLPRKDGKKVRIFSMLFNKLTISEAKWKSFDGEVSDFAKVPDASGRFDFATLHQGSVMIRGEEKYSTQHSYWESMSSNYTEEMPEVLHRPFSDVMPHNLTSKTGYEYVIFCVAYATDCKLLPAVVKAYEK